MYRQAAIIALDKCIDEVNEFGKGVSVRTGATMSEGTAWANMSILRAKAITGINIAKRLLEESGSEEECEVHIIQMDSETPDPFKTMLEKLGEEMQAHKADKPNKCPRCGTQIAFPDTKVCWFCGMALMADKGAE